MPTGRTALFRFHTGSIKRIRGIGSGKWWSGFDSILVRLKDPYRREKGTPVYRSFDSILVRLKANDVLTLKRKEGTEFRFHTGSIKRKQIQWTTYQINEFRFHTGSIKREVMLTLSEMNASFDSILVRLKACIQRCLGSWCTSFDSILVRLKGSTICEC